MGTELHAWAHDNSVTSISSHGQDCRYKAYYYDGDNYNGGAVALERNTGDGNLASGGRIGVGGSQVNANWDDRLQSGRFLKVRETC